MQQALVIITPIIGPGLLTQLYMTFSFINLFMLLEFVVGICLCIFIIVLFIKSLFSGSCNRLVRVR